MSEKSRIFLVLLHKSFLIRKRHWIQSIVLQILIPVALIVMCLSISNRSSYVSIENHPDDTHYSINYEDTILSGVPSLVNIRYTPSNIITDKIMENARKCLGLRADNIVAVSDENTIVNYCSREQKPYVYDCIGIVFESIPNGDELPKLFKYKLRSTDRIPTNLFDPEENGYGASYMLPRLSMAQIPICLDKAYINEAAPNPEYTATISLQRMPYPPYVRVYRTQSLDINPFDVVSTLAFLIVLCVELTFPANEKFIGINVLMLVNGITNKLNLLSWLVSGVIWSTSYLLPTVVLMKYYELPYFLPFLLNGNAFLVWVALVIHICHLFAFGLHLGSYFWKPFHGITAAVILVLGMQALNFSVQGVASHRLLMYFGIISPNFILSKMIGEITAYEGSSSGVGWSNLFTPGSDVLSEGSIGVLMLLSIIGIIFHFYMAVYIYAIRPGKYGVPQHPLHCFQWKKNDKVNDKSIINCEHEEQTKREFEYVQPGSLKPGIQIRDLKKVYATDLFRQVEVNALRGVSIDIYKSQITALLGHNGAGKTTMMSILSGLTDATEGVAVIDGENILKQTNSINNNIGLCPQENMLFPDLTVHQQLMLFGMIKANDRTKLQLENEVHTLLVKVNLTDKTNNYPAQLSGGQKRRLCLALAIIGDAKVLILDEPTSGMDAESKRDIWNILLKMRGEKTIVISTHDMEEADILGDRIAIMHTGKLRSYGTSMFLKKLHGDGQVEVTLSIEPWCNISNVSKAIGITAHILNQDDSKIVIALPPAESLPEALDKLENSKEQLGITGMSVSIITLEQVFVRVTKDERAEQDSNRNIDVFEKVTGFPYYLQTFSAFFLKKLMYARKNPWNVLICTILPCLSMIVTLPLFNKFSTVSHPYTMSLRVYPDARAFVHSDKPALSEMYLKTIKNFGGIATQLHSSMSTSDALLNYARNDKVSYRNKVIVSAEFNNTPNGVIADGFYSGTAMLGIPITINCITNTIVKALTNDEEYKIDMSIEPLPTNRKLSQETIITTSLIVTMALIILLAPTMSQYVIQPLSEISSGIKQLQMMTGAPKSIYWAATFLFDFAQYIISILLLLTVLLIINSSLDMQLYHGTEICITLALILLFGMSVLSLVYLCTFFKFSNNATIIILTIVPIAMVIADCILQLTASVSTNETFRTFRLIQSKIFLFVPHVSLSYGHFAFLLIALENANCRHMSSKLHTCDNPKPYFGHEKKAALDTIGLQGSLLWLGLSTLLYCGIIFILEQRYLETMILKIRGNKPIPDSSGMDEMVKAEKQFVNDEIAKRTSGHSAYHDNANIFLAQELRKSYGNLHAVKGISFRVKESECFGLLGVNGAGKSTTFKMLTGEIIPNGGTVYLKQYNNISNRSYYLSSMGYCPQQDAMIYTLNAWDHLHLFARLRGIPSSQVPTIVKQWVTKLNLTPCAFQASGTYSGGNKRRLNIALALIGNPPLVLMDEPTTGVDPAARRSLWNTLKSCQNAGQSIILTSHSMEECEELCNRLVIMVGGEIVCVGASEQLKQRFGAGYNIHVKLSSTQRVSDVEQIKQRIVSTLNCNLTDQNTGFLGYHVVDPDATWTIMYTLMDDLKKEYDCIEDYVVLSSTLEQLFIQFARSAKNSIHNHDNSNGTSPV